MALDLPSRADASTLAAVLAAVATANIPTTAQRQDMASAVRTAGRIIGRPLEQIPADPSLLARRLAEVSPIAAGISAGRWANVRSLLLKALTLTRPMLPGRNKTPLAPAWSALWSRVEGRGWAARLSRLVHWLSAQGIEPQSVTFRHIESFTAELRDASLLKDPERTWRDTASAWNKAIQEIDGWPPTAIPIPSRRRTYTLPWSAFPSSLKADVDQFLDRLGGRDLLQDLPFRPVRQETIAIRERQLRTFASALLHRGRDPTSLTTIADVLAFDNFKEGLRFFLERNGNSSSVSIHHLSLSLTSIARHHVGIDEATLARMKAITKRLEIPNQGMTRKNRERLRPFDDPANVQALNELPERLMREANSGKRKPYDSALLAQTAVALEILLMAPIRLKNLLGLEFNRTLVEAGSALHLVFEGHEVKNGQLLDIPLPPESAALLRRYRDKHRLCLTGPENQMLFPRRGEGSKSPGTFRRQIANTVFRYTGLKMTPHFFRHARVKIHLDRHPGEYGIVGTALGHRSLDTTRNYYAGFESAAAMRHFDGVLLALRGKRRSERK